MRFRFWVKVIAADKRTVTVWGEMTNHEGNPRRKVVESILRYLPGYILDINAEQCVRVQRIGS